MKKIIFLFVATLCMLCVLAFCVSAQEIEIRDNSYIIYNSDEYASVFAGILSGEIENKKIVFGCDIEVKTDIILNVPCDITLDLNGFTLTNKYVYNKSGDFDFQNNDAILRIKNGNIVSNFCVFIYRKSGQLYAENIDVSSNDECVYKYGGHSGILNLKNCNMDATGNYRAVYLDNCCGAGGMLYQIEGGRYAGFSINCPKDGSYLDGVVVYERSLYVDAWHAHGENGKDVIVEIRNVTVENGRIELNDRRVDPYLYDCSFTTFTCTGNDQYMVSFTSPTCTVAGSKTEYKGKTTVVVDEQYAIDNPALGHDNQFIFEYENGFMEKGYMHDGCVRCDRYVREETHALFSCLGYSRKMDGVGSMVLGFLANKDAIQYYATSKNIKFDFGLFAASKQKLGDNDILADDGSATSGVIKAEINDFNCAVFEIKIQGLQQEHASVPLALGAYVIEGEGEAVKISYLQNKAPEKGEKYHFIAYNEIE